MHEVNDLIFINLWKESKRLKKPVANPQKITGHTKQTTKYYFTTNNNMIIYKQND